MALEEQQMKFYRIAQILATQMSCLGVATLWVLSDNYLTLGHGLHPMLAGALMMFLLAWPHFTHVED
jgi:hypothetical protein